MPAAMTSIGRTILLKDRLVQCVHDYEEDSESSDYHACAPAADRKQVTSRGYQQHLP